MYQYSQDRKFDKWETVSDKFDILEDELEQDDLQGLFLEVEDFDLEEVL
jgi:hypothetical protein